MYFLEMDQMSDNLHQKFNSIFDWTVPFDNWKLPTCIQHADTDGIFNRKSHSEVKEVEYRLSNVEEVAVYNENEEEEGGVGEKISITDNFNNGVKDCGNNN